GADDPAERASSAMVRGAWPRGPRSRGRSRALPEFPRAVRDALGGVFPQKCIAGTAAEDPGGEGAGAGAIPPGSDWTVGELGGGRAAHREAAASNRVALGAGGASIGR